MPQSRRTHSSARSARLTAAGVLLGILLTAAWPGAAPAGAVTTATFLYTGAQQKFVVPAGVRSVHVLAVGGRGGNGLAPGGAPGGAPAEVSGDLEVFPGETLYVEVGGVGVDSSPQVVRAFNGGSYGGGGAGGGGGASDVRLQPRAEPDTPGSLYSRLIVAAGGGGGGAGKEGTTGGTGGQAGAAAGAASVGSGTGGGAGTAETGGTGCGGLCNGLLGAGTQGSIGMEGSKGGGGGGGLFGGGGGASNGKDNGGGGGGGGSSLQPPGGKTVVPAVASAPQVQISYTPPSATTGGGTSTPAPGSSPSGGFLVLRPIVGKGNSITLVLDVPGRGTATASATATRRVTINKHGKRIHKKVRVAFGTARATVTSIGALELTVKPSAAGRKALAAGRRLPVTISVTFAPAGEKASTAKLVVTLTRR